MTLGKKLQQLRKTEGMTQEQLAAHIMVSRQAVSKWELDESKPDVENILQLSKLFEVTADYLLKDDPAAISTSASVREENSLKYKKPLGGAKLFIGIELASLLLALFFLLIRFSYHENVQRAIRENGVGMGLCFLVQLIAVVLFMAKGDKRNSGAERIDIRKNFYTASIWLLTPIPLIYAGFMAFPVIRRPLSNWTDLIYLLIPYLIVCSGATFFIRMKNFKTKHD